MDAKRTLREIERGAARAIWKRRNDKPPSGEHASWEAWFLHRFGRTLDAAARDFREHGL